MNKQERDKFIELRLIELAKTTPFSCDELKKYYNKLDGHPLMKDVDVDAIMSGYEIALEFSRTHMISIDAGVDKYLKGLENSMKKIYEITELDFPVAMQLSVSDTAGYIDDERWWTFGAEEHGYSGKTYMGSTPYEAIEKFVKGEKL